MFVLYYFTLLPGLGWGDVAKHQVEATQGGFPLTAGLHPWYHLLTNFFVSVFPFGQIAWRVNFLSSILALLALYFFYKTLVRLKLSHQSCFFGTLLLALSHTFWSMALWAESYALFAVLWILAIGRVLLYLRYNNVKDLCWAFFFLGLGMGNNLIQPFAIPAIIITLVLLNSDIREFKFWYKPVLFGFLGLLPWLLRILYSWQIEGMDFAMLKHHAMDSKYEKYLFWNSPENIASGFLKTTVFCIYQFGLCLIFICRKKITARETLFLSLLIFTLMLFCSTYLAQRAAWLMMTAYIPLAFWITMAYDGYNKNNENKTNTLRWLPLSQVLLYLITPILIQSIGNPLEIEQMGGRSIRSFLQPWKHTENSAELYVQQIENTLNKGDVIVVDFTPAATLRYARDVENRLLDIQICELKNLSTLLDNPPENQSIYLGRYNSAFKQHMNHYSDWNVDTTTPYLFKLSKVQH